MTQLHPMLGHLLSEYNNALNGCFNSALNGCFRVGAASVKPQMVDTTLHTHCRQTFKLLAQLSRTTFNWWTILTFLSSDPWKIYWDIWAHGWCHPSRHLPMPSGGQQTCPSIPTLLLCPHKMPVIFFMIVSQSSISHFWNNDKECRPSYFSGLN